MHLVAVAMCLRFAEDSFEMVKVLFHQNQKPRKAIESERKLLFKIFDPCAACNLRSKSQTGPTTHCILLSGTTNATN